MEQEIKLRELELRDLSTVIAILKDINFKKIVQCFDGQKVNQFLKTIKPGDEEGVEAESQNEADALVATTGISIALDVVGVIIENYDKCEKNVIKLLSKLTGLTIAETESLKLKTVIKLLYSIVGNPDNKDFFKQASEFIK